MPPAKQRPITEAVAILQGAAPLLWPPRAAMGSIRSIARSFSPYRRPVTRLAPRPPEGLDFGILWPLSFAGYFDAIDATLTLCHPSPLPHSSKPPKHSTSLRRPILQLLARPELIKQSVEDALSALNAITIQDEAPSAPWSRGGLISFHTGE